MDSELTTLIAKPRAWQRWMRWPGVIILVLGLWSLAFEREPAALAFVAVGFWGASELWRGLRVTGGTLLAQGRVSRRTLPLVDIVQVGHGPMGAAWVQPRAGRTLVLHMAEVRTDQPGRVPEIAARLRELAERAGADLAPAAEGEVSPPRPATPLFGW
jgi:hypothetical protein